MAKRPYGSGSVYPLGDSWYGHWRSSGRQVKRVLGKVRQPGSREGLTRKQAEARLREKMANTTASRPTSESLRLAEVVPRYVAHLRAKGRKRSTITAVESCCRVWLVPALGDKALDRIQGEDVEDLMARMKAGDRPGEEGKSGRAARGQKCTPKTIRNYIGILSAIYRYAMHPRRRWATANPCDDVDLPEAEDYGEIRFYTKEEVAALIRHAVEGEYQDLDRVFYLTGERTGLRHGELIAWRWMDLDYPAMRVRVRRNYVLGEFDTPKSRRASRSLPFEEELAGELERWRKRVAARLGREPDDHDLVFADPVTGVPLSQAANNRRFKKALKAAGLDSKHRIHDLRHTFGVRCAAANVPMRTLQEWMGHRDISTTQRYADYAPSAHERQMLSAAFGAGSNPGNNLSKSQPRSERAKSL